MRNERKSYVEKIKANLLGPGSEYLCPDAEREIITSNPALRYVIGVLYNKEEEQGYAASEVLFDSDENLDVESGDFQNDRDAIRESDHGFDLKNNELLEEQSDDEDSMDDEISTSTKYFPSSLGISFLVNGKSKNINCKASFGTYKKITPKDCRLRYEMSDTEDSIVPNEIKDIIKYNNESQEYILLKPISYREAKMLGSTLEMTENSVDFAQILIDLSFMYSNGKSYKRIQHDCRINLDFSKNNYIDNNRMLNDTTAKITALRKPLGNDLTSITIMLVNDAITNDVTNYIFQPEIQVNTEENEFVFADFSANRDYSSLNDEEISLELQYRNKKIYGTGLGVACDWKINDEGKGFVKSDVLPFYEVPTSDFAIPENTKIDEKILSMKNLSTLSNDSKDTILKNLEQFIELYSDWIDEQANQTHNLDDHFKNIANSNIKGCLNSRDRMLRGLEVLSENKNVWEAFQLSNEAMFMQRVHLDMQEKFSVADRADDDSEIKLWFESLNYIDQEDKHRWRPFQLAFVLMSLESIADVNCKDRDIVDLIWFPTGGGKTEAYLGLTAFTIFYRRLTNAEISGGTSVIMRYTLRLLAAQQFNRASTLICSCEKIRKSKIVSKDYRLGKEEITIGLWIGRDHTPNTIKDAKEELENLIYASKGDLQYRIDKYNKFQVMKCPWCGTKLVKQIVNNRMKGKFGYKILQNRFQIFCPQEKCDFHQKLPIQVIDEELYKKPPTLLFSTVDKFAMFPWRKEVGNFFAGFSKNLPPELIIQDELHLISGPLGTMVGLYESIIDGIYKKKEYKCKIVASTATIQRAKEQCSSLYNRDVTQFPHPAIDASDLFYARESVISDENPGRLYVGLFPSGTTKATMQVRTISSLLQTTYNLDAEDRIKDLSWTITLYFNSLKELGKISSLLNDDIKLYIPILARRSKKPSRLIFNVDELTSRITMPKLNQTLEKLEKIRFSKRNRESKMYATDVLLATNMISVGVDISRLNVMLMVGQPKLTSEYIQASSRVGRRDPGVVFTMYDAARSRDRSHYEQFKQYHDSFYKFVEPTSVTPFSKPARERALHAVIVSILRNTNIDLAEEVEAKNFSKYDYQNEIQELTTFILDRNKGIMERMEIQIEDNTNEIAKEIKNIIDIWHQSTDVSEKKDFMYGLKYMFRPPVVERSRLLKPFEINDNGDGFNTMTSMRTVEENIKVEIIGEEYE